MRDAGISLFQTPLHACAYWPERRARDVLLDPDEPQLAQLYPQMLDAGFRRSGGHVYRPRCPNCAACVPVRVAVADFRPNRSQRRCLRRNAAVTAVETGAERSDEVFQLYRRYLHGRHAGGGMDDGGPEEFDAFLTSRWSPTRFLQLKENGRLLAVAVTDALDDALSAVYTFFDPDLSDRGLGTLSVLRQIQWAHDTGRTHLYLGFWIDGHPRMAYKSRFLPQEQLGPLGWNRVGAQSLNHSR